jgi:flagellar basal-body rod protein FlgF
LLASWADMTIESLGSAMQAQWLRHELLANNLANVSTPGFKQDDLIVKDDTAGARIALAGGMLWLPRVQSVAQWTDFSQGPLQTTGRGLDVALHGSGFLVVETPAGERFTRAGALTVDGAGFLTTPSGHPVLGERGRILLGAAPVTIAPGGELHQDGQRIDALRVVDFPRPYALLKEGDGLFAPADPTIVPELATGYEVVAGSLEGSNVNPVLTMVGMIDLLRKYEAAQRAIQAQDEANREAANEIGTV